MLVHGHFFDLSEEQQEEMLKIEKKYKKRTKLPTDPNHPMYYHVYRDTLPSEACYRGTPPCKFYIFEHYSFIVKDRKVENAD